MIDYQLSPGNIPPFRSYGPYVCGKDHLFCAFTEIPASDYQVTVVFSRNRDFFKPLFPEDLSHLIG